MKPGMGAMAGLACLLGACSALLPEADLKTVSPWSNFQQVKAAFDDIRPGESGRDEVHALGFDPAVTPNVQILNFSEIVNYTLPKDGLVPPAELPSGIRACLQAQEHCLGYQLEETRIKRDRVGGFWADFLNFRRETSIRGWRFKALIVMVDDKVVFKQWSGQPEIREINVSRNPLGPFQGAGERVTNLP